MSDKDVLINHADNKAVTLGWQVTKNETFKVQQFVID